jgi:hypothetical protein
LTSLIPEAEVLNACRALFGQRIACSKNFLVSLQPGDVKSAYRRRAKETHPDLFFGKDPVFQKRQAEMFRRVLESYDLVQKFFQQREAGRRHAFKQTVYKEKRQEKPYAKAATNRAEAKKADTPFYAGFVPLYRMEIGRYLYYRGKIPYAALIKALSWQRSHRPSIGEIALRWDWLNHHAVRAILNFKGRLLLFGERGVHLGVFTPFQVRTLLAYQRTRQKKLGHYFVEKGLLTPREMERMVAELKEHNARIKLPRGMV